MIHFNVSTATDTHFFTMRGGVHYRATGAKVGQIAGGLGSSTVVAGKYLITQERSDTDGGSALHNRNRADRKALSGFRVIDISDPAKPRQVNTRRNLLGYSNPPADYVVKNYLAEFDPLFFAGCYRGTPAYFGTDLGGVVPHGNKLLIQSTAYLYCIGENHQ